MCQEPSTWEAVCAFTAYLPCSPVPTPCLQRTWRSTALASALSGIPTAEPLWWLRAEATQSSGEALLGKKTGTQGGRRETRPCNSLHAAEGPRGARLDTTCWVCCHPDLGVCAADDPGHNLILLRGFSLGLVENRQAIWQPAAPQVRVYTVRTPKLPGNWGQRESKAPA